MNLNDAKTLLNTAQRDELRDHAFGDCEVYWSKDNDDIAAGYFGSDEESVQIGSVVFTGADARALRQCGSTGRVGRNDSTGPDEYSEGECVPALTRQGVLQELASTEGPSDA